MRWRLIRLLPAPVVAGAVILWQSGYTAPLLYGIRRWIDARPESEPDPVG